MHLLRKMQDMLLLWIAAALRGEAHFECKARIFKFKPPTSDSLPLWAGVRRCCRSLQPTAVGIRDACLVYRFCGAIAAADHFCGAIAAADQKRFAADRYKSFKHWAQAALDAPGALLIHRCGSPANTMPVTLGVDSMPL